MSLKRNIAVIDTETTFSNDVMSIGIVIADSGNFRIKGRLYLLIEPFYKMPAMFSYAIYHGRTKADGIVDRSKAISMINEFMRKNCADSFYAYNGRFDKSHLPELSCYKWYDIMRIAAYRQFNPCISSDKPCCSTGRLKSGYNVECIYNMLSGGPAYFESHNAVMDAEDELKIMAMLGHDISVYEIAKIN
ncbi:MAG: hypothetical protein ACI4HI_09940 [Lachnospiraceae bacterium]